MVDLILFFRRNLEPENFGKFWILSVLFISALALFIYSIRCFIPPSSPVDQTKRNTSIGKGIVAVIVALGLSFVYIVAWILGNVT